MPVDATITNTTLPVVITIVFFYFFFYEETFLIFTLDDDLTLREFGYYAGSTVTVGSSFFRVFLLTLWAFSSLIHKI